MQSYDPKDWSGLLFHITRTDTARRLAPLLLIVMAYSAVV